MAFSSENTAENVTATTPPAVYVNQLSFRYRSLDDEPDTGRKATVPAEAPSGQPLAIEDISFSLPAGELMLIAGPSGCGKSTLLKCLNGLIPNSYHGALSGEIQLGGRPIKKLSPRELAPREVDHVGLNVKADNDSAIACYERLGFERIATYEEYSLELKGIR